MLKFHLCCTHRVSWVLLPVCFLAGVMNYLDRTNLAFAALELNADLGFTPVVSFLAAEQQIRTSPYRHSNDCCVVVIVITFSKGFHARM